MSSSVNDAAELLAHAYRYTNIYTLLSDIESTIHKEYIRQNSLYRGILPDMDNFNLNVRFILKHPEICQHGTRLYKSLMNAFHYKMIDQPTSIKIAAHFPQITPIMIAQTPRVFKDNTRDAVLIAIEYPQMFLNNVEKAHIEVAITAMQNKKVYKLFCAKSYTDRMRIIHPLFATFKTTRAQLDGLFTILAGAGNQTDVPQPPTDESINILIATTPESQRNHHVLLAWSGKFISDCNAIQILGDRVPKHKYLPAFKDLISGFNELAATYQIMLVEIREQELNCKMTDVHHMHPVDY
jgi:hypothetical protein